MYLPNCANNSIIFVKVGFFAFKVLALHAVRPASQGTSMEGLKIENMLHVEPRFIVSEHEYITI